MEKTPAVLLKEFVMSQEFESTAEVMTAMKELFADVLNQVMSCELDEQLGYEKSQRVSETAVETEPKNYRNGYGKKTVKTQLGEVDIKVPRDHKGKYEPRIIGKYNRSADGIEEKIIGLYACGMSQKDISEQIKALYDVEISPELVSKFSEKIMPEVTAWQNRPLESVYPFVFMGHPLQGQGEPSVCHQGGLCGTGHKPGWREGHSGCLDRRTQERKVLDRSTK